MDVDEYLDDEDKDGDADENSSFSGEDDVKSEVLPEREKDRAGSISGAENEGIKEVDCEGMEEKEDYSDIKRTTVSRKMAR